MAEATGSSTADGSMLHHGSVQHLHGDVAGRARRRRAVNGRIHSWRITTTSDDVGPKSKVDESNPAEPLEATPTSSELGVHVKQGIH